MFCCSDRGNLKNNIFDKVNFSIMKYTAKRKNSSYLTFDGLYLVREKHYQIHKDKKLKRLPLYLCKSLMYRMVF